jgi:hypothetical protein
MAKKFAQKSKQPRRNRGLVSELWTFLKERKAWWLAPIIIMLVLVGVLIIIAKSSAISPFIYALF